MTSCTYIDFMFLYFRNFFIFLPYERYNENFVSIWKTMCFTNIYYLLMNNLSIACELCSSITKSGFGQYITSEFINYSTRTIRDIERDSNIQYQLLDLY